MKKISFENILQWKWFVEMKWKIDNLEGFEKKADEKWMF